MKLFNYASNDMLPWEYAGWIENAETIKGRPFDTVIIGIDFFATAKSFEKRMKKTFEAPKKYLQRSQKPLYRYASLISFDALKFSLKSIEHTYTPTTSDYDRKNVRRALHIYGDKKEDHIKRSIGEFKNVLTEEYSYNPEFVNHLKELKKKYPNKRFIIFTTPVSKLWFDTFIVKQNRFDLYGKWLRELVYTFGKVYHFMDMNSITTDMRNFFDAHHLYPEKASLIAKRITAPESKEVPKDFGKILTDRNIDDYLKDLKKITTE